MLTQPGLNQMQADRGPRHLVHGTIRRGEYRAAYATTTAAAEEVAATYLEDGLRGVRVLGPVECADLRGQVRALRKADEAARRAAENAREQLRAATLALLAEGTSEYEAADLSGVTRMTIRAWTGK